MQLRLTQTSKMEFFVKNINSFQLLTNTQENFKASYVSVFSDW